MSRSSKDHDSMFVVVLGTRTGDDHDSEGTNGLMTLLAVAIAMMVFVALVQDSDRRRLQDHSSVPTPQEQPIQFEDVSHYRPYSRRQPN